MRLSLAISPCPNDTFIFEAMVNQLLEQSPYEFDVYFGDVEDLNQRAIKGEFDITKLSYHAYTNCAHQYDLLTAGSALGRNCGPLLISRKGYTPIDLANKVVAIPGEWTTAHFLLRYFAPQVEQKKVFLFSEIEQAINNGEVDAGVIIHENRFTYKERGFHLIQDLGQYWEKKTTQPIPLGGIVIKKEIEESVKQDINRLVQESISYAWAKEKMISEFISKHASEMDEDVMKQHIKLYVNEYSYHLGEEGIKAVNHLFTHLQQSKPIFIQ